MKLCISFVNVCMKMVDSCVFSDNHWKDKVLEIPYVTYALQ